MHNRKQKRNFTVTKKKNDEKHDGVDVFRCAGLSGKKNLRWPLMCKKGRGKRPATRRVLRHLELLMSPLKESGYVLFTLLDAKPHRRCEHFPISAVGIEDSARKMGWFSELRTLVRNVIDILWWMANWMLEMWWCEGRVVWIVVTCQCAMAAYMSFRTLLSSIGWCLVDSKWCLKVDGCLCMLMIDDRKIWLEWKNHCGGCWLIYYVKLFFF